MKLATDILTICKQLLVTVIFTPIVVPLVALAVGTKMAYLGLISPFKTLPFKHALLFAFTNMLKGLFIGLCKGAYLAPILLYRSLRLQNLKAHTPPKLKKEKRKSKKRSEEKELENLQEVAVEKEVENNDLQLEELKSEELKLEQKNNLNLEEKQLLDSEIGLIKEKMLEQDEVLVKSQQKIDQEEVELHSKEPENKVRKEPQAEENSIDKKTEKIQDRREQIQPLELTLFTNFFSRTAIKFTEMLLKEVAKGPGKDGPSR